ncbi:Uncharacterized protein Adt_09795 [Abeliophyllum distichum]|uniref:Uncharacterized protein n=1 Tax=Abeliophyllum distichum TaxID=126358 RepID=A0ABD1NQW6_9LAMI
MGNPKDSFAAIANIEPNNEYWNYERQQIIHHQHVTLSINCPSCQKQFCVRANLTDGTTVITETEGSNLQHHVGEEANPVHKNRKPETNKKKRNRQAAAAAAVQNNNTPPNSAGKRGHAFVSDSEDDVPVPKKSNDVNRHLNFNK